jgi:hypothetical membrane protein
MAPIIGSVVFISVFIVLGFLQAEYSFSRQQISVLAAGEIGILLNIGFVFCGIMLWFGLISVEKVWFENEPPITRAISLTLLAVPPIGLILCGAFPFTSGFPHIVGANLACAFPILSFFAIGIMLVVGKRRKKSVVFFIAGSLTTIMLFAYFASAPTLADIRTIEGGGSLGLWERILAVEILFWYSYLGVNRRKMHKKSK